MKISFFGHFGSSNSGNEATLLAVLSQLRSLSPEAEFRCVCTNPDVVVSRDGIDAIPITTRNVKRRDPHTGSVVERLRAVASEVSEDIGDYVRAFKKLRGTHALIIPGTGLLTDAYGLSGWGPYGVFKWSLMAKLRRCKVLYVSVGVGPVDRRLGRFFVRSALALADYKSYRDTSSLNWVRTIGARVKHDRVYPDLVFSLPETLMPQSPEHVGRRRVVGVGLMLYAGTYSVANPRADTYKSYLETLAVFVEWLLSNNYDVRLLFGDDADAPVVEEFIVLLRRRSETFDETRILYHPITTLDEFFEQLAAIDIAVVTRFHNVLLSLLFNKPVIAISFHHKCTSLMNSMGLAEYVHDINQMNVKLLIKQFERLEDDLTDVKNLIEQRVDKSRQALVEQYELLFEEHLSNGLVRNAS